jgi:hypothetical protein
MEDEVLEEQDSEEEENNDNEDEEEEVAMKVDDDVDSVRIVCLWTKKKKLLNTGGFVGAHL